MDRLETNLDVAEHHAVVVAKDAVVVAGNVDDARAVFGLAENRANDVVVRLRPEERFAEAPHIDDVADEVKRFRLDRAQEVEQVGSAAAPESQMDVGDEDRAKPKGRLGWRRAHGAQGRGAL
jgi:hypothetical protein